MALSFLKRHHLRHFFFYILYLNLFLPNSQVRIQSSDRSKNKRRKKLGNDARTFPSIWCVIGLRVYLIKQLFFENYFYLLVYVPYQTTYANMLIVFKDVFILQLREKSWVRCTFWVIFLYLLLELDSEGLFYGDLIGNEKYKALV